MKTICLKNKLTSEYFNGVIIRNLYSNPSGSRKSLLLKEKVWASLVAQWLRIHLPMQATQVQALVLEDPTCHGATKPMRHNYWACALETVSHNYWARALQLLKPTCLKPVLCNMRSQHTTTKSSPCSPQLEKSPHTAMKTQCSQK